MKIGRFTLIFLFVCFLPLFNSVSCELKEDNNGNTGQKAGEDGVIPSTQEEIKNNEKDSEDEHREGVEELE
eukprot:Pgem_evm1s3589